MDKKKLNITLIEKEMTIKDLAEALKISPQAIYKKISGDVNVTVADIRRIKQVLNLTDAQITEIFLL